MTANLKLLLTLLFDIKKKMTALKVLTKIMIFEHHRSCLKIPKLVQMKMAAL